MQQEIKVFNTLSRQKEPFQPLNAPFVGMYVCGPTVYGDAHLGHARGAITFDIIFRYLTHAGYKVRYVRNITDVGHLENDADSGDDKIAKKAKLEQLEPMEVAYSYTNRYHEDVRKLNVLLPSIEPLASGHIIEQIEIVKKIIDNGFGYEANGSVYFDIPKFLEQKHHYGELSGRVVDDLQANTRDLDGQSEKRNPLDFALWKKAAPEHIMHWQSPWSQGFPGWHLECTAMSTKYLGKKFDIHGGGMDLLFPHHECEIAQSIASAGQNPAKYWLHNNMVTIDGKKMGKSLGNFITLREFFDGSHALLEQAYSPMTIRFYILQAQYRSTVDISNTALKAAQKAYIKLLNAFKIVSKLSQSELTEVDTKLEEDLTKAIQGAYDGMNDDFNTGVSIAHLFTLSNFINSFYIGQKNTNSISAKTFEKLVATYTVFFSDILGLSEENTFKPEAAIETLLIIYKEAKANKEYDKVDQIRAIMKAQGLVIKDMKTGIDWEYNAG